MLRLARACFVLASMVFVGIGALHIITHLLALSGDDLRQGLRTLPDADVFGTPAPVWNLWQSNSLLMGVFCLALGLSNIAGLFSQPKAAFPSEAVCLTGVFVLVVIFLMGLWYPGPMQIIAAPVGILLYLTAAIISQFGSGPDSE